MLHMLATRGQKDIFFSLFLVTIFNNSQQNRVESLSNFQYWFQMVHQGHPDQ